jgi:transcriptional regulator with XRE-family HTH domain
VAKTETAQGSSSDDRSSEHEQLGQLGKFIRSQRKLAQLSQRELARLTDLSDPYVSQIERGLHQPSLRVIRALAGALNVRAETMLSYAGVIEETLSGQSTATDTEAAIRCDEQLSEEQKHALLGVYRSFLATANDD